MTLVILRLSTALLQWKQSVFLVSFNPAVRFASAVSMFVPATVHLWRTQLGCAPSLSHPIEKIDCPGTATAVNVAFQSVHDLPERLALRRLGGSYSFAALPIFTGAYWPFEFDLASHQETLQCTETYDYVTKGVSFDLYLSRSC